MKKHILLGAALLSLMATSCSNDNIIDNDTAVVTGKTITLNATINNGADTRMTYDDNGSSMKAAWSNSESFILYKGSNGTGSTFTKTAESGTKFKGNDITGEGKYYAVYGNNISNNNGTLTIDLSQAQVGTAAENGIKEFMLATASELNSSTTLTFDHKLTVLKMTLTLPSDVTGKVSKVTVSGLHNKATYTLSTSSYAYADTDKKDITATNGKTGFTIDAESHKFTAYVAVFPEAVNANQVTIKATVGDNEYYYTIANARTLQENQVVPVNVTLTKRNFKSKYTTDDYKIWSGENCGSAVTYDELWNYLGAGVYWDNGDPGDNQQTYQTPDGQTYHTGLWVMKKAYIGTDVTGCKSATPTPGRPADINKYFFLPAAGYYLYNWFYDAGSDGCYWSSEPPGSGIGDRYSLLFNNGKAYVKADFYGCCFPPMAAE